MYWKYSVFTANKIQWIRGQQQILSGYIYIYTYTQISSIEDAYTHI